MAVLDFVLRPDVSTYATVAVMPSRGGCCRRLCAGPASHASRPNPDAALVLMPIGTAAPETARSV